MLRRLLCLLPLLILTCGSPSPSDGGPLQVAVASNFSSTAKKLALAFQQQTGNQVLLSAGSTGKHFAQIVNGAPFDLYFAADVDRPRKLEEQGIGVSGSRFTYAIGRLVLWTAKEGVDLSGGLQAPGSWPGIKVHHFAIANPQVAPYGKAAKELMRNLGVWESWQPHLVRGENIGQAFQFVQSGSADLGLVAASQVQTAGGSRAAMPMEQYQVLEQQAMQLTEHRVAAAFLEFVRSEQGQRIIEEAGYLASVE